MCFYFILKPIRNIVSSTPLRYSDRRRSENNSMESPFVGLPLTMSSGSPPIRILKRPNPPDNLKEVRLNVNNVFMQSIYSVFGMSGCP